MYDIIYNIDWDRVINIGMFLLGSMFIIVAAMQLAFEKES